MSKQSSGVIARTNSFINSHKAASGIVAGSLLASVAFVSAAAINLSGQYAMEAYSYPTVGSPVIAASDNRSQTDNDQIVISDSPATDTSTAAVSTQTATPASAPTVQAAVKVAAPAFSAPAPANTPVATPEQPVDQQPIDEPETAAGFDLRIQNPHFSSRNAELNGQMMHVIAAVIELDFDTDYDSSDKQFTYSATALGGGFDCEISYEKLLRQLHVSIPEASAKGNYICRITVSDGTVSRSTDYSVAHTALIENPQPADGYNFVFNMPVLGVIEGLNVYTSKYNYAAFPGCNDSGFYVCETTASIAFDVRVAAGLTVPQIHETIASEDYPGLSCSINASPSIENTGYGTVTLRARSIVEDGIYVCGFAFVEGEPASSGLLIVELVNGQFRSITSEQFNEL